MSYDILNYIYSSIGTAIITKTSVAPLSRVKVLQQLDSYHSKSHYKGFFNSVKYIYRQEGIKSFFKGNTANIYRSIPNYCLKFPLNEIYLNHIVKHSKFKSIKDLPFFELLKAGTFTGLVQT